MKMSLEHYNQLKESINECLQNNPNAIAIMTQNQFTAMRIRWECYHHSRIDKHVFYQFYNDNHIDTALKSILGELCHE